MIKREFIKKMSDGTRLYKTYSDSGFYIKQEQTGLCYRQAVDVANAPYTYVETDIPISNKENEKQ